MISTGEELSGAWNFRDVAEETGIRPGRLFRSSELSGLNDDGRSALARMGIGDVADLRSQREVERRGPGQVPDGVAVHLLPFHELSADQADAPHESAFEKMMTAKPDDEDVAVAAARFMTEEYRNFPSLPGAQTAVRQVISLLADRRSVITHCFAGKDRTGFTVALVLETVGVPHDAIVADFLRSNAASSHLRERILESIRNRAEESTTPEIVTFAEARLNEEVLGVCEEYLAAARRSIDADYGSAANYLEAVGVTADQVSRLREFLLT
ncbi:phosphotyrosine protein phosphatase [Mycobacterium antarcticum]|uniref:tyrosine-protein phosphatase n=1 Tax=Mycolicibacterium sp. TUM20983 TaxID=3023369 RepID=UPI00238F886D|nr:tyrosine-protein phosphatase [Mycolicibacterium sp. TUM20983]GLP72999.1 phosphotyrosine protein phosphatase [Mycolicibacterium sp. TUM20983]